MNPISQALPLSWSPSSSKNLSWSAHTGLESWSPFGKQKAKKREEKKENDVSFRCSRGEIRGA